MLVMLTETIAVDPDKIAAVQEYFNADGKYCQISMVSDGHSIIEIKAPLLEVMDMIGEAYKRANDHRRAVESEKIDRLYNNAFEALKAYNGPKEE